MDPFVLGYVRTIVMRFWKGPNNLNDVWQEQYNVTQSNVTTENATNLEEVRFEICTNETELKESLYVRYSRW